MNLIWLILIIPFSMFLGLAIMCWVGAAKTADFYTAMARRDAEVETLRKVHLLMKEAAGGGHIWVYADGVGRAKIVRFAWDGSIMEP